MATTKKALAVICEDNSVGAAGAAACFSWVTLTGRSPSRRRRFDV